MIMLRWAMVCGVCGGLVAPKPLRTTKMMASTLEDDAGAALRRQRSKASASVVFDVAAPAPGMEFLQGVMILSAATALREAGTTMVVCSDVETLRTVADESREATRSMILAFDGDDVDSAVDAGATALVIDDEPRATVARAAGIVPIARGLELARAVAAPVALVSDPPEVVENDDGPAVVVVCDVATLNDDQGVDGFLLRPSPSLAPNELTDEVCPVVRRLRSGQSKVFAGFLSNTGGTQLDYTDDQRKAVAWGNFVQNAQASGLVDSGSDDDDDDAGDLDEDRGDYRGFA